MSGAGGDWPGTGPMPAPSPEFLNLERFHGTRLPHPLLADLFRSFHWSAVSAGARSNAVPVGCAAGLSRRPADRPAGSAQDPRGGAVALVFGALILGLLLLLRRLLIPISDHQFQADSAVANLSGLAANQRSTLAEQHAGDRFPALFELDQLRDKLLTYARESGDLAGGLLESLQSFIRRSFCLGRQSGTGAGRNFLSAARLGFTGRPHPRAVAAPHRTGREQAGAGIGCCGWGIPARPIHRDGGLGVICSVGLAIIGLDFSLLIGMLAGLVSFVPYLGLIIGILAASIVALLQFHSLLSVIPVLIVFGAGQFISDFS